MIFQSLIWILSTYVVYVIFLLILSLTIDDISHNNWPSVAAPQDILRHELVLLAAAHKWPKAWALMLLWDIIYDTLLKTNFLFFSTEKLYANDTQTYFIVTAASSSS